MAAVFWFRQDLRTKDNEAFCYANKHHDTVYPIYILDDVNAKENKIGAASRLWLHHSLKSLNKSINNHLTFFVGDSIKIIKDILSAYDDISAVYWNECYEPWILDIDQKLKNYLEEHHINVRIFSSATLTNIKSVLKEDKTPYKVFTPFYKHIYANNIDFNYTVAQKPTLHSLKSIDKNSTIKGKRTHLDDLKLVSKLDWTDTVISNWNPGEEGAQKALDLFLQRGISNYKEGRNHPSKDNVSYLSPHLHFGEISVKNVVYKVYNKGNGEHGLDKNYHTFLSEIGWREFASYSLYHFPEITYKNLHAKFDDFEWISIKSEQGKKYFEKWKKGQTGYPIVDAGMRQLWQTGYMHNRLRMIVGSFLVKNLLIHWKHGERWFWDCLCDADLASNNSGWQWAGGCGIDASPYFRIFNPILQGEKFDESGEYTRKYLPELKNLPNKYLFKPFDAPEDILTEAKVTLGTTYPKPIVDLKVSRDRALNEYHRINKKHK